MTRFRNLLSYDPVTSLHSSPGDEQRRASEGLAHAVSRSHMKWWKDEHIGPGLGQYLVLVVAPYSQYDLTLLDLLEEHLNSGSTFIQVFVANLQDYSSIEQLKAEFPGINSSQTPIAMLIDSNVIMVDSGKKARDLAAKALGIQPEELARRVFAESPRYGNT